MLIESQELPPIGTNAFALIDPARKECLIIDAPQDAFEWAGALAKRHGCTITGLFLTHGHWDHMLDGYKFAAADIPVYGHAGDRPMFETPEIMATYAMPGQEMRPVPIGHWVQAGDKPTLLGRKMEVRHVPGHCPGNVLLYLPEEAVAFVGDVIFAGSVGRYDLPGGDFAALENSIKTQIYTLPDATVLYPGHGPRTTVADEKRSNPFVRA